MTDSNNERSDKRVGVREDGTNGDSDVGTREAGHVLDRRQLMKLSAVGVAGVGSGLLSESVDAAVGVTPFSDFEDDDVGTLPTGWSVRGTADGYDATVEVTDDAVAGSRSLLVNGDGSGWTRAARDVDGGVAFSCNFDPNPRNATHHQVHVYTDEWGIGIGSTGVDAPEYRYTAISNDGSTVVYASTAETPYDIRVHEVGDPEPLDVDIGGDTLRGAAFSPDDQYVSLVAADSWRGILVYETDTWERVHRDGSYSWAAQGTAFSLDGNHVSYGRGNGRVRVYETDSWSRVETLSGGGWRSYDQDYGPDYFAHTNDYGIYVYDYPSFDQVRRFSEGENKGVSLSNDGAYLAYWSGSDVVVRRTSDWDVVATLQESTANGNRNLEFVGGGQHIAYADPDEDVLHVHDVSTWDVVEQRSVGEEVGGGMDAANQTQNLVVPFDRSVRTYSAGFEETVVESGGEDALDVAYEADPGADPVGINFQESTSPDRLAENAFDWGETVDVSVVNVASGLEVRVDGEPVVQTDDSHASGGTLQVRSDDVHARFDAPAEFEDPGTAELEALLDQKEAQIGRLRDLTSPPVPAETVDADAELFVDTIRANLEDYDAAQREQYTEAMERLTAAEEVTEAMAAAPRSDDRVAEVYDDPSIDPDDREELLPRMGREITSAIIMLATRGLGKLAGGKIAGSPRLERVKKYVAKRFWHAAEVGLGTLAAKGKVPNWLANLLLWKADSLARALGEFYESDIGRDALVKFAKNTAKFGGKKLYDTLPQGAKDRHQSIREKVHQLMGDLYYVQYVVGQDVHEMDFPIPAEDLRFEEGELAATIDLPDDFPLLPDDIEVDLSDHVDVSVPEHDEYLAFAELASQKAAGGIAPTGLDPGLDLGVAQLETAAEEGTLSEQDPETREDLVSLLVAGTEVGTDVTEFAISKIDDASEATSALSHWMKANVMGVAMAGLMIGGDDFSRWDVAEVLLELGVLIVNEIVINSVLTVVTVIGGNTWLTLLDNAHVLAVHTLLNTDLAFLEGVDLA